MNILPLPARLHSRTAPYAFLTHGFDLPATARIEANHETLEDALDALRTAQRTIVEQAERIRQLENSVQTDNLTGLANKNALMAALRRELALTRRDRKNAGFLILLEMNDDAELSKTHGRAAADCFLQNAGNALLNEVRSADIIAHMGNGLFAVVMPQIDVKDAASRLARLEKSLTGRAAHIRALSLPFQVHVGFAFIEESETPESLLVAADAKLFASKARKV